MPDSPSLSNIMFVRHADGHRLRCAILEPNGVPRGTILIAPGRREFIEKKQSEMGYELLQRGLRLIIFEWRGEGLSDRFLSGPQRQRDHITDFNLHLKDLDFIYETVVQPNTIGPLFAFGHSMGGHLILRWLAETSAIDVTGTILTAPMMALGSPLIQALFRHLCQRDIKRGRGQEYAFAQHDYNKYDRLFPGNPLTNDPERFKIIEKYFAANPDMVVGGVTKEWLNAALESMSIGRQPSYLGKIKSPTLIIAGGKDRVIPLGELKKLARYIPHVELAIVEKAKHDSMNDVEPRRIEVWQHITPFLDRFILG